MTGTNVCESTYDVIIAKPIASASGRKSEPGIPDIDSAGANTAMMQKRMRSFGNAISRQASQIATDFGFPVAMCWWMFSIVTVDSSTRMPIANASPLRVMMLMVCPKSCKNSTDEMSDVGIVRMTIAAPRGSPRKSRTINPVSNAPIAPSESVTSSGSEAWNRGSASFSCRTTSHVEASADFAIGM